MAASIRAATILAQHDGYLSDHRALVVDFDAATLFGGITSEVIPPVSRRLTSTNPSAVHTYVHHMLHHISVHNLVEKVSTLKQHSANGAWPANDTSNWELIDELLVQGRAAAEAKCPAKQTGGLPWSPELDLAGKRLLYWRLRCRKFTSGITNIIFLESLASSLQLTADDTAWKTAVEVRTLARRANKALRLVKTEAAIRRAEHLSAAAKIGLIPPRYVRNRGVFRYRLAREILKTIPHVEKHL